MKKITLLLCVMSFFALGFSQDEVYKTPLTLDDNEQIYFEEIISLTGFTSEQIYAKIRYKLSELYRSSKTVIDLDDKENGKIIIKGIINYTATDGMMTANCPMYHTLKIFIKDEKVKVRLENLRLEFSDGGIVPIERYITDQYLLKNNGKPRKMMKSHKEGVIHSWYDMVNALENSVKTSEDDW